MRWFRVEHNDKRTRVAFALLPVTISNETRWLETVKFEEKFISDHAGAYWSKCKFIDDATDSEVA